MLNICRLNSTFWLSPGEKSFMTSLSILNIPSPMKLLRTPDSPGHLDKTPPLPDRWSYPGRTGHSPLRFLGFDASGAGPFGIASPSMFQFVDQVKPLSVVIRTDVSPLRQHAI